MIENLLSTLKSEVGGQIMNQTKLPAGKMDQVFGVIGDVTKQEIGREMTGGGLANVMNLFSKQPNNTAANQLQSGITSGVINGLAGKLGISKEMAGTIAQIAVPALINLITKKNSETPDDDPSPLNNIFGGIGKGSAGDVARGMLGKFLKR